jgi:hypothetical protein
MFEQTAMSLAANVFKLRILRHMVAIYAPNSRKPDFPDQVGTGFLISHNSRPVLVTAAHVFYGASFTEDPGEKSFFANGGLVYIDAVSRQISQVKGYDVAVLYLDELAGKPQLPFSCLTWTGTPPRIITIGGYLARDFKRSGNTLQPAPLIYTNNSVAESAGHVGLNYTKRKNKDTFTHAPAVSSIPKGLSGGPMVETLSLLWGELKVVGVFTEQDNGRGKGVNAEAIKSAINSL